MKRFGVEKMTPESHKPLGTPLSSPGTPLVPLVVEWKENAQFQMTESFIEIETVEGEKTSDPPGATVTLVSAAEDLWANAAQNNNVARIAVRVLRRAFTMNKRRRRLFCSRKVFETF